MKLHANFRARIDSVAGVVDLCIKCCEHLSSPCCIGPLVCSVQGHFERRT